MMSARVALAKTPPNPDFLKNGAGNGKEREEAPVSKGDRLLLHTSIRSFRRLSAVIAP